ncbi:DUF2834 domain-containing protein [Laspinema olomoucense]|uniref:DUF2834 domain-containing protein n=1 Tax=Laspinema olomoucense D3b TaxID=2953688 RepID=A0ABT2N0F3_9CYAN|nr:MULTISPECIES: DUF2834 domain-containing protein [unclassified Laspinema]MCT7974373.1 DUF2834 domain-containing protein [Laspinema sp. D3d]MCT7976153.1 DUF2834 domain-containing protein [Laspinema sp. D3b]MCT7990750.1 DUF2834 domain-containing protein [Laspinema sp. D3a]MCT7994415.1 DUF2834 domain-containing protein [Laspinema sp. D3c]
MRKLGFGLIWIGLIIYAFGFAPPDNPTATFNLIKNLVTGEWEGINPLIIALFNIMGVWPLIYSGVLFLDGKGQKVPAWPFVTLSFGVGAFALLPYLALRQPNPNFSGEKNWFLKAVDSRIFGAIAALSALILVGYGITQGNWTDYFYQWQTSRFIHVMTLDFCLLCLLFPTILGDDMARRGLNSPGIFWLVALIPLLGPAFYLALRPPVQVSEEAIQMKTAVTQE